MHFGDLTLHRVHDGDFRLDGGAMFGVVPKVLWQRYKPADEKNRIRMATGSLLVERGDDLLLIDTGIGTKNDEKFRGMFGLEEGAARLPEHIRAAGFELSDVTHVLSTHLHFDHCGWNTRYRDGDSGELVATFPNATYWIGRREVEHARHPNERDGASYDDRNWEPLFDAGVVELFDDEAVPIPGVRAVRAPGHTDGMCVVVLNEHGAGDTGIFLADLVPTAAHVPYPWIMGFDLYPMTTLEQKKQWLPRLAAGGDTQDGWVCFFQHDPEIPCGRVVPDDRGRYRAEPIEF